MAICPAGLSNNQPLSYIGFAVNRHKLGRALQTKNRRLQGAKLTAKTKGSTALVVDDVLHLTLVGQLSIGMLREAIDGAMLRFARVDDTTGAILFDMTAVQTDAITGAQLALAWRAHVPACPAAILYRGDPGTFWHVLLMRLASHPAHPAPLLAFPELEKRQAIAWARDRAATFRAEQARRHP